MKKTASLILTFVLIFCMLLTACTDQPDNTPPTPTPPAQSQSATQEGNSGGGGGGSKPPVIPSEPPTGYQFYTLGDLRFAYPDTWGIVTDGDGVDSELSDEAGENKIQFSSGSSAQPFQNITASEYQNTISSMLEAQHGWEISDETAEKRENALGLSINVITVKITIDTVSLRQVIYATTINDVAYSIMLTLAEENSDLEEKLFDSMVNINPTTPTPGGDNQDPLAPAGYKTFSNYNLSFAYPSAWTTTATAPTKSATFSGGLSNLALQSGPQTTMFEEMTLESFQLNFVPDLEDNMSGTISNESVTHQKNINNLNVTRVSYSVITADMTLYQYWFCATVDQTTHWLILTLASEDTEMVSTIVNSMKATNGDNYSSSTNPGSSPNNPGSPTSPSPDPSNPDNSTLLQEQLYNEAIHHLHQERYEEAYYIFLEISDYADVPKYLSRFSMVGGEIVYNPN